MIEDTRPFAETDTIAAVATPPGTGALAVLRVSGPGALAVVSRCTSGRPLEPRRATLCRVTDAAGETLDHAVATYFAGPASFTGENTVEISCHGGMLVTQRLLARLIECGARPAEPGEFSQRAFLNGKLDLTQAEAVMDVISAASDLALRAAQSQLEGAIGRRVGKAADALVRLAAHVEAHIDFPDEDIAPDTVAQLQAGLAEVRSQLAELLDTADRGRLLREGIRTAIVGRPNVGKSSLLNTLLGYERAIVSPVAGTTRDTIEENVHLGGLCLRLIDTAGLHESADAVERAGMERSRQAEAEADLVLEVADASLPPNLLEAPVSGSGALRLLILNKADLGVHPTWSNSERYDEAILFSCATGEGRRKLEQTLAERFVQEHALVAPGNLAAVNARHRHALSLALDALDAACDSLARNDSPELTALDLRDALDALGSITGHIDTEDILTAVFSQFCLGK